MKKIGIIVNHDKDGASDVLPELGEKASHLGLELVYDDSCSGYVHDETCDACEDFFDSVDYVMTLGGDGTLLGAVRRMGAKTVPLIGVNFGTLGFLTSVTRDQLDEVLEAMADDSLIASKRRLMSCTFNNPGEEPEHTLALNDMVLSWGKSSHIATLEVSVDGDDVTTYTCDGLIVATATGSTGHSLSAGGPILTPDSDGLILNPICPHAMTVRPVVLSFDSEVTVRLAPKSKTLVLACDGQPQQDLKPGGEVKTCPSDVEVDLLHLPGYAYWEALRSKLNWRGSSVEN